MKPAELAYRADVGVTTIYRYLSGNRAPHADILERLASALSCSTDELLGLSPIEHALEVPDLHIVHLPLLHTPQDVGEASQTMAVPAFALPDLPLDVLAVVVPDEAAPDLCPDDLVIIARRHEWTDGNLLSVIVGDHLLIRRGYREPDGRVLVVGREISDRARIRERDVVGRVMTSTRSH